MHHMILLHTNDIHGRIQGLARVATLVEALVAANPSSSVLYVSSGWLMAKATARANESAGIAISS